MHRLLTSLAAASALAFFASAGLACDFHATHVTASVPAEEVVAMSTADDATKPVVITTEKVAATECPAGQTNCTPANK